ADLQRIIDDLRKRREMLEQHIAETASQTVDRAKTLLDAERLLNRFRAHSGPDDETVQPSPPPGETRDKT
ncbi:MAG TPA: hypothetical protein VF057_03910, partial [Thermoanaerobaculia bacterium]